uniref:Tetraspanin n=1 Tax=Leptobrachium leishanense TaxID=445787 RepID=A0A8C5QPR9_9ANUR
FLGQYEDKCITGVALMCIGASVQLRLTDVSVVLAEAASGIPLVLTVVGMMIFFLAGFGAFAALRESNVLIKTFAVIMLLVFVVEIVVGISAYTYRDRVSFKCCGAQNFTDWLNTTSTMPATAVPKSCCRTVQLACGKDALDHMDNIFLEVRAAWIPILLNGLGSGNRGLW